MFLLGIGKIKKYKNSCDHTKCVEHGSTLTGIVTYVVQNIDISPHTKHIEESVINWEVCCDMKWE